MESNKRARDIESLDELLSIEFTSNQIDLNSQLAEVRNKVRVGFIRSKSNKGVGFDRHRCRATNCGEDR